MFRRGKSLGFNKEQHQELMTLLADLIEGLDAHYKIRRGKIKMIQRELASILKSSYTSS
jgi:hypothetical protein